MAPTHSEITRRLIQAQEDQVPVALRPADKGATDSVGFVLGVSKKWIALQVLQEGFFLDDIVLLRLVDVRAVKPCPEQVLVRRVVSGRGVPIERFPVELTTTSSDLLRAVAARADLVCLYYEGKGHRWREVGTIRAVGTKQLEVHGMREDGSWYDDSGLRRIKRVRRIEFGGRYLETLREWGEPLPPASVAATQRIAALAST